MEQKNITTSIQILNELMRNDFLHVNQLDLNLDFYKNIIKNKKIANMNELFEDMNDKNIYDSSFDSTEVSMSDSIPVTNFTIPSSMYNKNTTTNISTSETINTNNSSNAN
jgi:hypothetical protein